METSLNGVVQKLNQYPDVIKYSCIGHDVKILLLNKEIYIKKAFLYHFLLKHTFYNISIKPHLDNTLIRKPLILNILAL